jgi:replicative DNA helicase
MTNEEHIISQLAFYHELAHYLPKINPQWFTDPFHKKIVKTLTKLYVENEKVDMVQIGRAFERKEVIRFIELQQRVSGMPNIEKHMRVIEYAYIKKRFIDDLSTIDLTAELPALVKTVQEIVDNTSFTTLKDPKSVIKETNRVVDEIAINIQNGNKLSGNATGWRLLDKYIGGWNAGDLVVVAGRPGMGKTAIALTLVKDFAAIGGKALFLGLEMSNEQLVRRYISLIGEIPNYKIRNGNMSEFEIEQMCEAANAQSVNFYIDDEAVLTVADIRGKAKLHKSKHGLELLVIDYIQLIKGNKQNREQEIAEISRNLKLLAKELNITVIILAQLSRKSEERQDKRPLLSDLRESGAIEQDADIVLFPFRPAYYDKERPAIEDTELIIGKNRNGECVVIPTKFNGSRTLYTEDLTPRR